jgi:plasmid stability protein
MAKITVSVPDKVYDAARLLAAEAGTSVSALVREYLTRIAAQESDFVQLLALQEAMLLAVHKEGICYSATNRMTRDEVHDREALN